MKISLFFFKKNTEILAAAAAGGGPRGRVPTNEPSVASRACVWSFKELGVAVPEIIPFEPAPDNSGEGKLPR